MRESTCLFVGNLSYNIRERELRDYMERCGRVKSVTVGVNTHTGQSKGYGFVEFEDRRDAEEAVEKYNGMDIDGRKLRIDWDLGIDKKMSMPAYRARRAPFRGGGGRRPGYRSSSRSPRRSLSPPPRRTSRSPRRSPRRSYSPSRSKSPIHKRSRSPSGQNREHRGAGSGSAASPTAKRQRNYR